MPPSSVHTQTLSRISTAHSRILRARVYTYYHVAFQHQIKQSGYQMISNDTSNVTNVGQGQVAAATFGLQDNWYNKRVDLVEKT